MTETAAAPRGETDKSEPEGSDQPAPSHSAPGRALMRLVDVRPEEVTALAWSWLLIFAVLSSYYILRPIRDQMGVAGGVNNLQWLFTGTLAGMLILNVPYGYLVKTYARITFIPIAYRFFAVNILLFALVFHLSSGEQTVWAGRVFFIWTSIFNLFVVSIFWAMLVDVFTSEQGKRLFGFIAAGATLGSITGSAITAGTVRHVSPDYLLIGAAILLEVAVFSVRRLSRVSTALSSPERAASADQPVGGTVLGGLRDAFASPYLVNVSLFLVLYAVTSTFLYFQQASIVSVSFQSRSAQTAFFATLDLVVNVLTLSIQLFLTGRLMRKFGVGPTLSFLPAFSIVGFAAVAAMPTLTALAPFQVLRRAGNFAISRPAREVLFTVVAREDRYKAKSFIDTFMYRLGDQVGAWSFAALTAMGLGLTEVSMIASVAAVLWLGNSVWLGRREKALAERER